MGILGCFRYSCRQYCRSLLCRNVPEYRWDGLRFWLWFLLIRWTDWVILLRMLFAVLNCCFSILFPKIWWILQFLWGWRFDTCIVNLRSNFLLFSWGRLIRWDLKISMLFLGNLWWRGETGWAKPFFRSFMLVLLRWSFEIGDRENLRVRWLVRCWTFLLWMIILWLGSSIRTLRDGNRCASLGESCECVLWHLFALFKRLFLLWCWTRLFWLLGRIF